MTEQTTAKVVPRKGESDTSKLPRTLGDWFKIAKGNPWVLLVLAGGSGISGQEVATAIGQNVQWWWIALGVAAFAAVNFVTDKTKRDEKFREDIRRDVAEIKVSLRVGAEKFENIENDVKSLRDWRKEVVARQVAAASGGRKPKKGSSEGSLRTA